MSRNVEIKQKTIMSKELTINDKDKHTFILSYYRQKLIDSNKANDLMLDTISEIDNIYTNSMYNSLTNEQLIKELSLLLIDIIEIISYL